MKRVLCVVLAFALVLALCACGGETAQTEKKTAEPAAEPEKKPAEEKSKDSEASVAEPEKPETADSFICSINGVAIPMEAQAAPILEALGEYQSLFDMESCAGLGTMRYYTYSGFELGTYEMDESGEKIYSLLFTNDLMETAEGICLGDPLEKVQTAYAGECELKDDAVYADRGDSRIIFILAEGKVSSVEYVSLPASGMSVEE